MLLRQRLGHALLSSQPERREVMVFVVVEVKTVEMKTSVPSG